MDKTEISLKMTDAGMRKIKNMEYVHFSVNELIVKI